MNNNNNNDLSLFTEFLKETCPMIFNDENINRMMNEFEMWKENHTYKEVKYDFTDMIKKSSRKK